VSVHVGATRIATGLVDLRARLIARGGLRIEHAAWGRDPGALVDAVARQVAGLLAGHRVPRSAVVGAGVGVPGWVDGVHGVVRRQPQLGWKDVPLAELLTRALDVPVVVDEHVRAMAAAEAWFGEGRGAETLSLLFVGAEVGCSHVIGRHVLHGYHAAAGSVGFLPAWPASDDSRAGPPETRRTAASLEAAVSEAAVFEAALQLARRAPESATAGWLARVASSLQPRTDSLAALAERTGDAGATALLRQRATALAPFVAHVLGTFDPELLVVAGAMSRDTGLLQLRLLREAVVAHAPELGERLPALKPSAFGQQTLAVSPGALVLRELYTPPLAARGAANGTAGVGGAIRRRAFTAPVS
jgi:predicted NBD/HSP70 family sugar kinase